MSSHRNAVHFAGFDLLRLLAAVSVIFSHSYFIAAGSEDYEPLRRLLGSREILGLYGVFTFFAISGFLLMRSLAAKPNAIVYVVNRTLRILPAFVFCTLVTTLLIGPLCSSLGVGEYFSKPQTLEFVRGSLNCLGDMPLPGVFAYADHHLATAVNGSLWSLRYEALSYLLLLVLWLFFRSPGQVALACVALAVITTAWPMAAGRVPSVAYTLPYFAGGVAMGWVHRRFGVCRMGAGLAAAGLVVSGMLGIQAMVFAASGAYLAVFFGERVTLGSELIARVGDCSYGLYLFAWPVQQMIKQWTGTTEPLILFGLTLPLAFVVAYVSCHWIERPAMRLRRPFARRFSVLIERALGAMGAGRMPARYAARVGFMLSALAVLTARGRWYYFMESMAFIAAVTLVSTLTVGLLMRCLTPDTRPQPDPPGA